jgi:hypothetical protein
VSLKNAFKNVAVGIVAKDVSLRNASTYVFVRYTTKDVSLENAYVCKKCNDCKECI